MRNFSDKEPNIRFSSNKSEVEKQGNKKGKTNGANSLPSNTDAKY